MLSGSSVNKQLGEFVYIVSHDLKAPLRGLASLDEFHGRRAWCRTEGGSCRALEYDEEPLQHACNN